MEKERRRAYSNWAEIKNRCYDEFHKDFKSYGAKGVTLCNEWLDFKNFYEWYKENHYEVEGEYMAIDKDILGKDSKIYSPENCVFVPFRINGLFVHKDNGDMRGLQKLPSGYQVKVRNPFTGKNDYYGTYKDAEVAKSVYRQCKKQIIVGMAEEYKGRIPDKVYQALLDYEF